MRFQSVAKRLAALGAVLAAASCGSGMLDVGHFTGPSNGGGGSAATPASYVGVMGDSLKHGTTTLTVSASLSVTGTLTFAGGPTVPLTGVVDTAAGTIHASGSGYVLTGFANLGAISGSYTGPAGNGFLVASSDSLTGGTHKTYCGTYTSTNSSGRINFQILSDGDAGGFVTQLTGTAASSFLTGTVVGNQTFTGSTNSGISISGTLSSDLSTIIGLYAPPVAGSTGTSTATGTFTASIGGC